MIRNKFVLLLIISFICGDFIYSQNINKYNDILLPYKEYTLIFTIVPPSLVEAVNDGILKESNIGKKEDVFILTFTNNSVNFEINPITENFIANNQEGAEIIKRAYSEITMLVRYLCGFYFGSVFSPEMEILENDGSVLKIGNQYEYKGVACENIYILNNEVLKELLVKRIDNSEIDVSTNYDFINSNCLNYLSSFHSKNEYHNFLFNLNIHYKNSNNMLVPDLIYTEVESNGINTKFEYLIYNQQISKNN